MENFNFKSYKIWLIIAALIFTFLLVYSPHFSYSYPLHIDEWLHIEQAQNFSRIPSASISKFHPEITYQIFLKALFNIEKTFNINPILAYKFLPALFAVFAAIFLFMLIYKLTKNYWISLFSIIFFASLPSNVNLLGLWFAVPLTLAIPLMYLFFHFFYHGLHKDEYYKKDITFAAIILFLIALIHAPTATFIFPILIIYSLINYKKIKNKPFCLIIFLPFLIYSFLALIIFWKQSLIVTLNQIIDIIKFESSSIFLEPSLSQNPLTFQIGKSIILANPYFLPVLYGIIPFSLALIGLYFSLKNRKLRILGIWLLVAISLLFLANLTEISFLARRQRITYYTLVSLAPLSAIGLYKLINYIKDKLTNKLINSRTIKIILIIIILITLTATFYNYGKQEQGTEIYHLIDDADYEALTFLKTQEKGLVLAPLTQAATVYAITQNEVLSRFWPEIGKKQEIEKFFSGDCKEKQEIIEKYNIDYVYSEDKINCEFKEIYNQSRFIYKTS